MRRQKNTAQVMKVIMKKRNKDQLRLLKNKEQCGVETPNNRFKFNNSKEIYQNSFNHQAMKKTSTTEVQLLAKKILNILFNSFMLFQFIVIKLMMRNQVKIVKKKFKLIMLEEQCLQNNRKNRRQQ